jgi:hypothetical protein
MGFLVRRISETAGGRRIVRDQRVEGDEAVIGRAAECAVHLPDLAVAPEHARITALSDRRIRVAATGTLGFQLDGRTTLAAEIDAAKGAELRFGGHRVTVSLEDGAIVLAVERVDALSEASEDKNVGRVFSLKGLAPPKRATAWTLAIVILIAFLAVPIWGYIHAQTAPDHRNIYTLAAQHSWSSGPLSQAHRALENNCEACHQKAFVSVRDTACLACHKDVHDHAPPARIAEAREQPGLGGRFLQSVAHAFGKPGPGACVDCHVEHLGAGPMPPTKQAFCTDCHATLKARLTDTKLGDATDFGTLHPQFSPAVMLTPGPDPKVERISLDKHPSDDSGLKFPHALHLSASGGVAQMARALGSRYGFGKALECKDCHTPTADGTRFLPVSMERNCQMCHSLAFEKIGGTVRTLRHGDVAQVIADIRAYYRSTGPVRPMDLSGMSRRQPGQYAAVQAHQAYSGAAAARPSRADAAIRSLFTKGGACYDCHTITPPGANGAASWTVTPVHQSMRYLMHGWFDHSAHSTETCESCHAARQSDAATDLLIPGIKTCRACHGGENSRAAVPSGCALCHSYHQQPGAPWQSEQTIAWTKMHAMTGNDDKGAAP